MEVLDLRMDLLVQRLRKFLLTPLLRTATSTMMISKFLIRTLEKDGTLGLLK